MTHELQKRFRPKSFRSVVGQDHVVKLLQAKMDSEDGIPHALLLSGPSGVGKTTIGRILQSMLKSGPNFTEMDAARNNGIDTIRRIEQRARMVPLGGGAMVWLIDEAHQLTTPAQQAFLKILEDTPKYAYFFLATTNPGKLIPTIRNRCTHLALKMISDGELRVLVNKICKRQKIELDENVLVELVKAAEGSARKVLVLLDSVREHDSIDDQMDAIKDSHTEREAIEICRIMFNRKGTWKDMAAVLKSVSEEPESLRRMILGYARTCMLNSPHIAARASIVIQAFQDNFYDSGQAGLAMACWEVMRE